MHDLKMEITDSGDVSLQAPWWHGEGVRSPYSRLYLIRSGIGKLRSEKQEITMLPGYAYLIPAGTLFDYWCDQTLEKLYFHITLIKSDGYDLAETMEEIGICKTEDGWLEKMTTLYRGDRWLDAAALTAEIYEILGKLMDSHVRDVKIPIYSETAQNAMQYIRENLSAGMGANEVAAALYISKSALNRVFQKELGKTVRQYAEDMVFAEALRQMIETDRPLGDLATELGFCDPFYFSRRFRQRYGETPREYRKRLREFFLQEN
ncbi:MAG: AraC family transcriptional regulator [Lachnospiraceae bacterium]|nr:AraC family transcriptional regulator [Lachnospiraceae bacterium]